MWWSNLPRLRGKLSQVTFSYKMVINNHSVAIEGNPIVFNCNQGFIQNFGISQPSQILNAKNAKILKQNLWQPPIYPTKRIKNVARLCPCRIWKRLQYAAQGWIGPNIFTRRIGARWFFPGIVSWEYELICQCLKICGSRFFLPL